MPTYEYQCDTCLRVFEVRQRISEPPLTECESCGGRVKRLLSPAPFILKGGGWYVTDYPSESRKKAMEAEKKSTPEKSSGDGASSSSSAPAPSSATSPSPASSSPSSGSSTTSSQTSAD